MCTCMHACMCVMVILVVKLTDLEEETLNEELLSSGWPVVMSVGLFIFLTEVGGPSSLWSVSSLADGPGL